MQDTRACRVVALCSDFVRVVITEITARYCGALLGVIDRSYRVVRVAVRPGDGTSSLIFSINDLKAL